jgi:hypothetical protein
LKHWRRPLSSCILYHCSCQQLQQWRNVGRYEDNGGISSGSSYREAQPITADLVCGVAGIIENMCHIWPLLRPSRVGLASGGKAAEREVVHGCICHSKKSSPRPHQPLALDAKQRKYRRQRPSCFVESAQHT